jgi:hypothetical protein
MMLASFGDALAAVEYPAGAHRIGNRAASWSKGVLSRTTNRPSGYAATSKLKSYLPFYIRVLQHTRQQSWTMLKSQNDILFRKRQLPLAGS